MTFLPKLVESRADLFALLIALPLSLAGTALLFFLASAGSRIAG